MTDIIYITSQNRLLVKVKIRHFSQTEIKTPCNGMKQGIICYGFYRFQDDVDLVGASSPMIAAPMISTAPAAPIHVIGSRRTMTESRVEMTGSA